MKLLFYDVESTGLSVFHDRIIQISITLIDGDISKSKTILINPTIPISEGAYRVHNITDDIVKNSPTFPEVADKIYNLFDQCDWIITYNGTTFDLPMLACEFLRCGYEMPTKTHFDVYHMVQEKEKSKKLKDVYFRYTGEIMKNAHDAQADVAGLIRVWNYINKI
jgi:DNA polymerase-3 subunit epsilon